MTDTAAGVSETRRSSASSLVIINPAASRARDAATLAALTERVDAVLLERDGARPRFAETASGEAVQPLLAEAVQRDVRSVIAVGGDGTVRAIAAFLADTGMPLGIIPAGAGNQVAAVMGIPRSPLAAVEALATAQPRTIDLGTATVRSRDLTRETVFVIGCGAGFDAQLMTATSSSLKRRLGPAAYFVRAVPLMARLSATPCRVTVDGESFVTEATAVLIGNMGQLVPGRVNLRLPLDPGDGLLDLIVVSARNAWGGIRGLADQLRRTQLGTSADGRSVRLRGRRIAVEPEADMPLEIDGDPAGLGALEAVIRPRAMQLLVPAD